MQEDGAEQREREGRQGTKAPWNNSFFHHSFHHGGWSTWTFIIPWGDWQRDPFDCFSSSYQYIRYWEENKLQKSSFFFLTEHRRQDSLDSFFSTKTSISRDFFLLVFLVGFRGVCFRQYDTRKISMLFERSITMKKSCMFFWVKHAIPICIYMQFLYAC